MKDFNYSASSRDDGGCRLALRATETLENALQRGPEHVLQRAGKQDDQTLDDDNHITGNVGMSKAISAPP